MCLLDPSILTIRFITLPPSGVDLTAAHDSKEHFSDSSSMLVIRLMIAFPISKSFELVIARFTKKTKVSTGWIRCEE